jgi:hypothetical protein
MELLCAIFFIAHFSSQRSLTCYMHNSAGSLSPFSLGSTDCCFRTGESRECCFSSLISCIPELMFVSSLQLFRPHVQIAKNANTSPITGSRVRHRSSVMGRDHNGIAGHSVRGAVVRRGHDR